MQINSINNYKIQNHAVANKKAVENSNAQENNTTTTQTNVHFNGFWSDLFSSNKFKTKAENKMYDELSKILTGKDKKNFDILYKTGRLSNRDSNDKSSTLENLYKIYKNPRVEGLNSRKILSETIERIANPFIINQKFGKIPENIGTNAVKNSTNNPHKYTPKTLNDLDVKNSACCVAASIEFSLADKKPAEFARYAEALSSKDMAVIQNIKLTNLNKDVLDAIYLLKLFNVKPIKADWKEATIKIEPDKDAIIRARVQSNQYNGMNRSSVDVLMQSAFMQLGSQGTYNSLTDKRLGFLTSSDNTGLIEFEKTFVESVVNNDGEKTSVVYQNFDNNSVLQGYFYPPEVVQNQLLNTLKQNKNIIIGITEVNAKKEMTGGHELTLVGYEVRDGELYFICNDTDDDYVGKKMVKAKEIIPQIHHAGIPVANLPEQTEEDNGKKLLREYATKYLENNFAQAA